MIAAGQLVSACTGDDSVEKEIPGTRGHDSWKKLLGKVYADIGRQVVSDSKRFNY